MKRSTKHFRSYVIFLFIIMFEWMGGMFTINARETLVVGYVRSKSDKLPIPSANIYFEGTTIGVQSDEEGFFVLRNAGSEDKVVFSSLGYKSQIVTIKVGEPMSVNVELREDIRVLQELFVVPGVNPATLFMKKVREAAAHNDIHNSLQPFFTEDEELVLMPVGNESMRRRFEKWSTGLLSTSDSTVFLPLYIANEKYLQQGRRVRQQIEKTAYASPENLMILMERLAGSMKTDINFYNNNLLIFNRNIVSPLSTAGNSFYMYYLVDSTSTFHGKEYLLRFRSKNQKNLAFNGEMRIDSATYALRSLTAQLPRSANLNYINEFSVHQEFCWSGAFWYPSTTELKVGMRQAVQVDSARFAPELFFLRRLRTVPDSTFILPVDDFAGSEFQKEELEYKLAELNEMPLMKTARWIADIVITGYAQAGKIDVGKIYQLARFTEQEGLRLNVPLRTNELLSPNATLGGYWGYGLGSKAHYFSVNTGYKLPIDRKTILRAGFTNDLRLSNFDYNEFMVKENPLLSGDVDIANTLFSLTSMNQLNRRREWLLSLSHDWSKDVESGLHFRSHRYYGNEQLPFISDSRSDISYVHRSLTMVTRFSSRERRYEDHLDRIYVQNERPVVYLIAEVGTTNPFDIQSNYIKVRMNYKHKVLFPSGQWMYSVDAGWLLGDVPYNLFFNHGSGSAILHRRLHFNLMNYMEYTTDHYVSTHHEWMFNGILFNAIPGIRNFNLRELVTFKGIYGGLSNDRKAIYQLPVKMRAMEKPYIELGVGITNIFKIGSIQSVWRVTERHVPGVKPWGLIAGVRFNF
jgi:hypothetical protein